METLLDSRKPPPSESGFLHKQMLQILFRSNTLLFSISRMIKYAIPAPMAELIAKLGRKSISAASMPIKNYASKVLTNEPRIPVPIHSPSAA